MSNPIDPQLDAAFNEVLLKYNNWLLQSTTSTPGNELNFDEAKARLAAIVGERDMQALKPFREAFINPGVNPEYHRQQVERLKQEWPVLYNLLAALPKDDELAHIYLMTGRKQWDYEVPKGWKEIAWERFSYVECGVFAKSLTALTDEDKKWLEYYGEEPEGWITPAPYEPQGGQQNSNKEQSQTNEKGDKHA